jgi:hypothetical protein
MDVCQQDLFSQDFYRNFNFQLIESKSWKRSLSDKAAHIRHSLNESSERRGIAVGALGCESNAFFESGIRRGLQSVCAGKCASEGAVVTVCGRLITHGFAP